METLKCLYARLRLRINEAKSAVARPEGRKFLGYRFWNQGETVRRRVPPQALGTMKGRVRQITSRTGGRSRTSVAKERRGYLVGWREYYSLAETPSVFRDIDTWIRH